jgi:membrane-bound lytic murein transglycosylase F
VRERLPLLSDKAWYSRVQRGFAPGQTAVKYVDNVRRYYEILMWLDSHETLTSQEFAPPDRAQPAG